MKELFATKGLDFDEGSVCDHNLDLGYIGACDHDLDVDYVGSDLD